MCDGAYVYIQCVGSICDENLVDKSGLICRRVRGEDVQGTGFESSADRGRINRDCVLTAFT